MLILKFVHVNSSEHMFKVVEKIIKFDYLKSRNWGDLKRNLLLLGMLLVYFTTFRYIIFFPQ